MRCRDLQNKHIVQQRVELVLYTQFSKRYENVKAHATKKTVGEGPKLKSGPAFNSSTKIPNP